VVDDVPEAIFPDVGKAVYSVLGIYELMPVPGNPANGTDRALPIIERSELRGEFNILWEVDAP
jgi:hypothetical protein